MPIRPLPLVLALSFSAAHAQTSDDVSPHALCAKRADALLTALGEADYALAAADFDAALRARYPAATLEQDYTSLPSKYGPLLGRGRPHVGDVAHQAVVMTPLIFAHGTLSAEVHCNADGSVSDVRLAPAQVMQGH